MFKTLKNKQDFITILVLAIVVLHPLIELDYLLVLPFPRLTTIVDYLFLPFLVLIVFIYKEKEKRKLSIFSLCYFIPFILYFIYHIYQADKLQYNIYLPNNYIFVLKDEVIYTLTLLLPLIYIYVFDKLKLNSETLLKISTLLSIFIALPIFISNLFCVSKSTYVGNTYANFLTWFSLPFDNDFYHPRRYASKFFFEEGNTIGILLLALLPFLYYSFYQAKNRKQKWGYFFLILCHSLAMIMLSTRIATYGSLLVPLVILVGWFILIILKKECFKKDFLLILVLGALLSGAVIPFSPAYQNQLIDAQDYGVIKREDNQRSSARQELKRGSGLTPFTKEWRDFYTYMFEEYQFLMNVTPPIYYTKWYDYRYDPKFWVDLIFDYELEERVNGRQIENIFTHFKFDPLPFKDKLTGLGYSTFMRGGIVLEQDFKQQLFTYGYLGFLFLMLPWALLDIFLGLKLLFGYHKGYWTLNNFLIYLSINMMLLGGYLSGHVLDELSTTLFLSVLFTYLLRSLKKEW